jgi:hypothetical protein
MGSLLQRVKDLSLDRRGDIRLIPDPRYFAAHPELRDLMVELAQLRLHSRAGLYILLLPRCNVKFRDEKKKTELSTYKIAMEDLSNRYWKKGAQLGRIQKVICRQVFDEDYEFDVIPAKEFIGSGCNLWDVGIRVGWLKCSGKHPVTIPKLPLLSLLGDCPSGWWDIPKAAELLFIAGCLRITVLLADPI